MQHATLCMLIDENTQQIILGMKKRGFGAGKYNGFGGKPKGTETIKDAAVRELYEEAGVCIDKEHLSETAELTFLFPHVPEEKNWNQIVHVYLIKKWAGTAAESDEMKPESFPLARIPYSQMWVDDQHWLPLVLQGKYVKATFVFGKEQEIVEKTVQSL